MSVPSDRRADAVGGHPWKRHGNHRVKPGENLPAGNLVERARTRIVTRLRRLDEARRNGFDTPVTPEVAGSSPVAPVESTLKTATSVAESDSNDRRLSNRSRAHPAPDSRTRPASRKALQIAIFCGRQGPRVLVPSCAEADPASGGPLGVMPPIAAAREVSRTPSARSVRQRRTAGHSRRRRRRPQRCLVLGRRL